MNFNCDDIKNLVVKVSYEIDKNKSRESSGVIVRPEEETDYFFVLTVKHAFKDRDEQTYKDVDINSIETSKISLKYNTDYKLQPLKIIGSEHDLVILVIRDTLCKDKSLKYAKVLDGKYKKCGLVGYPEIANDELECFDKCTYSITQGEIEFKINTNESLQSTHTDEIETTKGYSGSGLFTKVDDIYRLTGIISEVIPYKNSFRCVSLSSILKNIPLDEFGGIEIVQLKTPNTETSNSISQSNTLEKYKIIIQEQITEKFQSLKKQYLDGSTKEIKEWIKEIRESEKWDVLTDRDKAQIIYEEARISANLNQYEKTQTLIEEIKSLDNSLYINRLLSWIEFNKKNIDKAIELLDNHETSTLNQKIALYIEIEKFMDAKRIIDSINIEDKNYETYRLQAIYELYNSNNNFSNALKNINKALKLKSNYLEAKRIKAIILFYKATLIQVLSKLLPPMIQTDALKIDIESQQNINQSISLFNEIIEEASYDIDLQWLNSILWISDRKQFIENIKNLYEDNEHKNIAVQFILIYNLNIDIDIQEDIREIESMDNPSVYDIDKVIRYYFRTENKEKVFELLEKYKTYYIEENFLLSWYEHNVHALFTFKSPQYAIDFINENKFERSDELKAQIYKNINDYTSACEIYEKLYKDTQEPFYRFAICEIKAEENNWKYITEYTDYLLENFKTEKVVELVIYAEYNTKNFQKVNKLVDKWLPFIKNTLRKENFLRMKALSKNNLGYPQEAIEIYEKNNFMETNEDVSNLTYLYKKTNSQDKIDNLAVQVIQNPNIDTNTKIQISSTSKNRSILLDKIIDDDNQLSKKELALSLWHKGIMNELVVSYLPQLIEDKSVIGAIIDLNEIKEYSILMNEQKNHEDTLYKNSNIPIHNINKDSFDGYYQQNDTSLFVRSAKKYNFTTIDNYQNKILYLDITSLLLLFSLNKLQLIIDVLGKTFLSSNIFLILDEINAPIELEKLLTINFKLKKIHYSPEVNKDNIDDEKELSNLLISIYTLLEFEKENTFICIDDRYVNSFQQTKNKLSIISSNDILFTLFQEQKISKEEYYSILIKVRKRKYLYILITTEEIIYHLKKCSIANEKIIEREDLKALKNYLNFLVQHFRYIKSFTTEELQANQYAEPFFVINQEREIQNSIIKLWNEEFEYQEDRYVYLNWIMENIFVFNMSYFIRRKLPHSDDITMTMHAIGITSLLTQAITICSNENQKLYFEWFCDNYLNRFFIVNPELFENSLNHIKEIIVKTFIKENSTNIEKAIVQNLIMNFPDKIKNALGSDKKIQDTYLIGRIIGIDKLKFTDRDFIEKVTKVINGSKKEVIHTVGESVNKISIVSNIIQNKKEIEIINDNEERFILDRRFFILLTSAKKRRDLLYEHPEWLEMSNARKKCVIQNLNSIKIHYDRFEALFNLIEKSSLYNKIEDFLKERKMNFQDLCPDDINVLLDYFRIDEELPIEEVFNNSIETLMNEEDIYKTINIAQNLPIEFHNKIINYLNNISFIEQKKILFKILKTSRSPIGIMHLLNVLLSLNNDKFHLIIRYLIKQIFSDRFKFEFNAFVTVLNYVKQEFNRRYIHLDSKVKLALIWAHTNKLIRYFNAYRVDSNWINENFKEQTNMITLEIFRQDSEYNRDILNDSFSYERFVVSSLCYAYKNDFNKVQGKYVVDKINKLVDFNRNSFNFIRLNVKTVNAVNSFLELKDYSVISNFIKIEESLKIIDDLILSPQDNHILLNILFLKYDTKKLNSKEENRFIEYINSYDLNTNKPTEIDFYNVLLMIKQLKNIADKNIAKKVIGFLFKLSEKIETEKEVGLLSELLIYLSIYRVEKLELRIKLFVKYISMCKKLHGCNFTKHMVNKFLNELPLKYSNYFLLLKFDMIKEINKK